MANYDTLKATIDAYIRANGVKAITGPVLNGVLRAMVDSLGNGFLFAGEALPNGDPGTPDQNVVRYATQAGTYTNYGGYVHDGKHLVWFVWHGSWYAYPTQVPTDAALVNAIATAVADFYTKAQTDTLLAGKQAKLESGTNIKTINGESILGSGDITIQGGGSEPYFIRGTIDFNQNPPAVTITSGTYAEALAAYNAGTPVYAALTEGNGAVNIYPLAQVISPFLVFIGIGADSVLAVVLQSDGTVTAINSALVHPSDLAPVATSGDYDDLTNKPTIPAAQVQSDWNEADNTDPAYIKNKPTIPTVPDISTDIVTDRASDTKTASPKAVFDASAKYGVISQTQTWSGNDFSGYTYALSDIVRGAIPLDFINNVRVIDGAVFNDVTGYFELNDLTDISYEEMMVIHEVNTVVKSTSCIQSLTFRNLKKRPRTLTIVNNVNQSISFNSYFRRLETSEICELETVCIGDEATDKLQSTGFDQSFYRCNYLRKIGIKGSLAPSSTAVFTIGFNACASLTDLRIVGLNQDLPLAGPYFSSQISMDSLAYIINNASTGALTITVSAAKYTEALAEPAVTAALAAHTNVTLASA